MRPSLLRRNRVFRSLWSANLVSVFGDQFTVLGLPALVLTTLHGSPGQAAALYALASIAPLVVPAVVSPHIDRTPDKLKLLVSSDVARVGVLGVVVVAGALGALQVWELYVAAVLIGLAGSIFSVAGQAYLPHVVDETDLAEANSKNSQSGAIARIAGPIGAGVLIGWAGATLAIVADALSFLGSALIIWACWSWFRSCVGSEPSEVPDEESGEWSRIKAGWLFVWRSIPLRSLVISMSLVNLGGSVIGALWYPYLSRDLSVSPDVIGALSAVGSVGALGTATLCARIMKKTRESHSLPVALAIAGGALWLVPLASACPSPILILALYQILFAAGAVYFSIGQSVVRQHLSPPAMQGRVYAVVSTIGTGTVPVGGALASVIAGAVGQIAAVISGSILTTAGVGTGVLFGKYSAKHEKS